MGSKTVISVALMLAVGCAATRSSELDDSDQSSSSSGAGGTGGGFTISDGGGDGTGGSSGCSEAAKLIYVVGVSNELYSFSPQTMSFDLIGYISCSSGAATPFSMAVDRSGMGWVLFSDGRIFNVDTADASCTATSFIPNQVSGFSLFGMGFVSDSPGGDSETLYIGSFDGYGLGKIDLSTLSVQAVGSYDLITGAAEITGTGDAQLYGFFSNSYDTVAEIDKSNGHILTQHQPDVEIGDAWAFAFWGGHFWLFTNPNMGASSQVDRYDPVSGTTTTEIYSVGFRIVGAGVSTCAPVSPPR